jgi:hypothetical protein
MGDCYIDRNFDRTVDCYGSPLHHTADQNVDCHIDYYYFVANYFVDFVNYHCYFSFFISFVFTFLSTIEKYKTALSIGLE